MFDELPVVALDRDHESLVDMPADEWPWEIPAVQDLLGRRHELGRLTVLVGENGSGKSTIVEAIAQRYGLSPEGGSTGARHRTRASESELVRALKLVRGRSAARWGFFLRAETMHGFYTYLEQNPRLDGAERLHEMSHGESFVEVLQTRFHDPGLYVLDEPESALSFTGCLALVGLLHGIVNDYTRQAIVATHSPVVAATPGATILEVGEWGLREATWNDLELVQELAWFPGAARALLRSATGRAIVVGVPTRAELVERHVLDLVAELGPGAPLPGERDLAASCGVSRMTVRHALHGLAQRRIVERRHGAGTFVSRPAAAQPLLATSFHDDMRRRGLTPSSRVLDEQIVPADAALAGRLRIPPGDPVLLLRRLRLADDEPMALETLHVPVRRVPGLTAADLDADFYATLRKIGVDVIEGRQSASPVVVTDIEATLLGVLPGSAAWHFARTSRDRRHDVVEYRDSVVRADRYLIETEVDTSNIDKSSTRY